MGDSVERALEETVPILLAAKRAKLLSSEEIDQVVRKRRNHEYTLKKKDATRAEYLQYASFERELSKLLEKRADKRKVKKTTVQLIVGKTASRVNLVYSRAVKSFRGDVDLWLHYARHCVKTGTIRTAQKVLARAIAYRGDSERTWLAAVALHFDTCGDAKGARTLAQRALRAIPHSCALWKEYFRLEVFYLSKLIIRRLAIGLQRTPTLPPKEGDSKPVATEKHTVHVHPSETQQPTKDSAGRVTSDESEDPTSRKLNAEAESEDGSPVPSDSEASEEDLTSDTSDSSSDEEKDDSEENEEHAERLSFWEGGVPMTVFRRACDGVNLSAALLLDFWNIAVSGPYIPTQLLRGLSTHIRKRFPENIMSRLIEARLEWDCARTECQRHEYTESELGREVPSNDYSISADSESKRQAMDAEKELTNRLRTTLQSSTTAKMKTSEQSAAVACLKSIVKIMKTTPLNQKAIQDLNTLLTSIDQEKSDRQTFALNQIGNDKKSGFDSDNCSLASLEEAITKGKTDSGEWQAGDVVSAVKQKAGIPFRDIHHDKIVTQFLELETDIESVRKVSEVLLSTPPLTMQGIRCMIAAEMRILDNADCDSSLPPSQETILRLRRLFAKAESLSGTRHDVEFWLLFLDFERRKAKDSREAAVVHAKAVRTLTKEKVVLFTELHSLRNLY